MRSDESDRDRFVALHEHDGAEAGDSDQRGQHGDSRAQDQRTGAQQGLFELSSQLGTIAEDEQPAWLRDWRMRIPPHRRMPRIMPAPAVALSAGSIRIRLPVVRFSR